MDIVNPTCLRLDTQRTVLAFDFALLNAGSNMPDRMAMMAMTTKSSMRVNAHLNLYLFWCGIMDSSYDCTWLGVKGNTWCIVVVLPTRYCAKSVFNYVGHRDLIWFRCNLIVA